MTKELMICFGSSLLYSIWIDQKKYIKMDHRRHTRVDFVLSFTHDEFLLLNPKITVAINSE